VTRPRSEDSVILLSSVAYAVKAGMVHPIKLAVYSLMDLSSTVFIAVLPRSKGFWLKHWQNILFAKRKNKVRIIARIAIDQWFIY
jgi:hypothetical protein